ncbi:MAG TPA: glycosyltransferase family 39 protein [Propionibacteriaceae bacterium]|nr:glycosyltransferase family 39 protein [Propionibacteriaceae bacterium]
MPVIADAESDRRAGVSTRTLLLACLPAVAIGVLIRVWLMRTSLVPLNADEGVTGLQAYEVLRGKFRLIVAGNDYGATTETYLIAPFLTLWSGVWPLRIVPTALSVVAGYALYRLARPILGRVPAAALALIGWTTSGAVTILFLRPYMGYTTGYIALIVALALACHAMRTERQLTRTAGFAGFAAGFAIWSHPIFGTVALLALIAPTLYRRRALRRWWLPLTAGGLLGVSPWLLFIARNGLPVSASPVVVTTYPERVARFVAELLPRAFGLRPELGGDWVGPDVMAIGVAVLLISGAIVGMVLLVIRKGRQALPILVAGVLAFPVLALYAPLGSIADGRYALPFLPELLMGLGAWLLLIPERIRHSPWLLVTVPTAWALVLCVPVVHQQAGWQWIDPDADAKQMVSELETRQIPYIAGDYWGAYLVDYLGAGRLQAAVHLPIRFEEENATVNAADPSQVAFVYQDGQTPYLRMPADHYHMMDIGLFDLYLPLG